MIDLRCPPAQSRAHDSRIRQLGLALDHPEGIAASPSGVLYAGGSHGDVYAVHPTDGATRLVGQGGGWLLGMASDGRGRVYACDCTNARVLRFEPENGTNSVYSDGFDDGRPFVLPNACAFTADGRLIVTDSGESGQPNGSIGVVPPGGGPAKRLNLPPLRFPNGLAVEGTHRLVVAETDAFAATEILMLATGFELRTIAQFGPDEYIDGVALTTDGAVVISCYQPNRVIALGRGGSRRVLADDPSGSQLISPTNITFAADGGSKLYAASLLGWHLTEIQTDLCGQAPEYPDLP